MKHPLFRLKSSLTALAAALLCCALFASCGASPSPVLPDGLTEESVAEAAAATVAQLNENDYDMLFSTTTAEMTSALADADFAASWEPVQAAAGAFSEISNTTITAQNDLAVAIVTAKYENGDITFTLSYDAQLKLAGLFMK